MKCPDCGGRIGRFELSPNCKHCGVNIFYSQQEALLTEDAKKCELEYATFRILVSKLKTAFIGSKIAIFRIVAMVLAIGAICVPFATVSVDFSMLSSKFSFGAFGVYQAFSDGTLNALLNLNTYAPDQVAVALTLLVLIVLIFLSGFGVFATLLLSFIDIRKTAKVMQGFSLVGMVFSLVSGIISVLLPGICDKTAFLDGETGMGAVLCLAVLLVIFILNRLVVSKNIQPDIKQVDIERIKIRKQIKNGEIKYSDLPLPILESDEERKKRLSSEENSRILAEKAKEDEKYGK